MTIACLALGLVSGCSAGEEGAEPDLTPGPRTPSPTASTQPTPTPATEPSPDPVTTVTPAGWSTDFTSPWGITWLDNGDALVTERDTGVIARVTPSEESTEIGRIADVVPSSEGGLLGIAVDGERVYVYYSTATDNRLVSLPWDGTSLGTQEELLTEIPVNQTHNGGQVIVGPDGFLYVSTGDAQNRDDAQDENSLAGKILRLTTDGEPAPDNPFGNEVYSLGHRNVQGLAFDDDGRLWASEFGDKGADELNLIEAGGNYGWPVVEGTGGNDAMIDPVATWATDEASPSGLAYWRGSLWMAGLRGERLWQIPLDGESVGDPVAHLVGEYGRLRTVSTQTADAEHLIVGTSNTDGRGQPREGDDRLLRLSGS